MGEWAFHPSLPYRDIDWAQLQLSSVRTKLSKRVVEITHDRTGTRLNQVKLKRGKPDSAPVLQL